MAEMTIRLEIDPNTGQKKILVDYNSDADALPMEHEQAHKDLVDKLIEKGMLSEADRDRVIVEREDESAPAGDLPQSEGEGERQGVEQGH